MSTYFFETMTTAQAMSFNGSSDTLIFSNPTSSGSKMTVLYNAATALQPATVTLIDNTTGRAVDFSEGIEGAGNSGHPIVFPDGSNLVVGSPGNDGPLNGTAFTDGMFGGDGNDTLAGGAGADLIQGNKGDDSLNGGVTLSGPDTSGNDTMFGGQGNDIMNAGGGSNFVQGNLGDDTISAQGSAVDAVNIFLGGQGLDFITGGIGGDILSGDLGNDTLVGNGGADSLAGVGGNDSLVGGTGNDTFAGGIGADVMASGGGADLFIFVAGDSPAGVGLFDQISGWNGSQSHITFGLGASSANNFDLISTAAVDFNDALFKANAIIGGGAFVAVPVGLNLMIFADTNGDHQVTAADTAVLLLGKALADIDFGTIR